MHEQDLAKAACEGQLQEAPAHKITVTSLEATAHSTKRERERERENDVYGVSMALN
jgi:hypothetical protein